MIKKEMKLVRTVISTLFKHCVISMKMLGVMEKGKTSLEEKKYKNTYLEE